MKETEQCFPVAQLVIEIDNILVSFPQNPTSSFLNSRRFNKFHYETNRNNGVQKKIYFHNDPKIRKNFFDVKVNFTTSIVFKKRIVFLIQPKTIDRL